MEPGSGTWGGAGEDPAGWAAVERVNNEEECDMGAGVDVDVEEADGGTSEEEDDDAAGTTEVSCGGDKGKGAALLRR